MKQKVLMAPDFPWFAVEVFKGETKWYVRLVKKDIGYVRTIQEHVYEAPLEAFLKFDKIYNELQEGQHHGCCAGEGEAIF